MIRRPPRSTRTDTLFPYTTLFRSARLSIVGNITCVSDVGLDRQNPFTELGGEVSWLARKYRLKPNHFRYDRSEEHTSELQSLMRISYAVFCLKKQQKQLTYDNKIQEYN